MKVLDHTYPSPAENLACDEALLDLCDEDPHSETLRFWESSDPFVVVGYANCIASEVHRAVCEIRGVPIFRRCSGGGTVLQGPGCLNYTLAIRIHSNTALSSIAGTNRFVMDRHRLALQSLIPEAINIQGHTDLAIDGVKFSGNAQRRRQHALLFHGTILLHFDLSLVEALLPLPSHEPSYRQGRGHREFVRNFPSSAQVVKSALSTAWSAREPSDPPTPERIQNLLRHRYSQPAWNFKF